MLQFQEIDSTVRVFHARCGRKRSLQKINAALQNELTVLRASTYRLALQSKARDRCQRQTLRPCAVGGISPSRPLRLLRAPLMCHPTPSNNRQWLDLQVRRRHGVVGHHAIVPSVKCGHSYGRGCISREASSSSDRYTPALRRTVLPSKCVEVHCVHCEIHGVHSLQARPPMVLQGGVQLAFRCAWPC